jgi:hypothetical protein
VNLADAAIVLRPRGVAEIFDLAFRVCAQPFARVYLRLSVIVLLPGLAACLALRFAAGWEWPLVWAVALAWGGLAQGVFTAAAGKLLFSPNVTTREVLAAFGRRLGDYVGALVASRTFLSLSIFTFFLALPWMWIRVMFVHEAALLEGAGAVDAIRRASRFVEGRGGTAFEVLFLMVLSQVACVIVAELLGEGLLEGVLQLGSPFGKLFDAGGSPAAIVGLLVSVPYVATARFLQYIDARTRADGWDVQVRFMAIAASEAEARRPGA